MESRTSPGPENLGHHEAVLACLRRGGLSWQMTAHAYAIVDAFIYGFALQETPSRRRRRASSSRRPKTSPRPSTPRAYPHLVGLTVEHVFQPGYEFGDTFEFGLDLILEALRAEASIETS